MIRWDIITVSFAYFWELPIKKGPRGVLLKLVTFRIIGNHERISNIDNKITLQKIFITQILQN